MRAGQLFEAGNAHYRAGELAEAAKCYRGALQLEPRHGESHNNLGAALADLGQIDEAIASYLRALQLIPDYADAHFNLGNALRRAGQPAAARTSYARALELQPNRPEFLHGWADWLAQNGFLSEADAAYRRALEFRPHSADIWTSLGLVLAERGCYAEAFACHSEAIRLQPELADAYRNRSLVRLLLGDFRQGWQDYEWRWRCRDFTPPAFTQPRWRGDQQPQRTVLLYGEQGIGDTLQFVRYAPLVKARVGRVILAARRELIPLLRSCAGIDEWVAVGDAAPTFDVHCPLMSLPHVLSTTLETVPATTPYLQASPDRIATWRARLGESSGRRVGVCWRGSPGNKYYRTHGIPLEELAPLAAIPNVQWISLQQSLTPIESSAAPFPLIDLSPELDRDGQSFMDTAAVVSLLDLVISFDTAVAHLAGALGKPVWIAVPWVPDWRWLLERDDSPWYPTARLFRQSAPGDRQTGDWQAPVQRMAEQLT